MCMVLRTNDDWECCIAGSAVSLVRGGFQQWSLVARRLLFGAYHNSYRAEAFAVLLALDSHYKVTIKSDCKAVVDEMLRALRCYDEGHVYEPNKHTDIWMMIWHHWA